MNQVARKEPDAVPAAPSETIAFMHMIERAARDPNVDVDKMERLLALREREQTKIAEQAFNAALTRCQQKMRPIAADLDNGQTRSKYASYMALDKVMRPIFTEEGFALSFNTEPGISPEVITVLCDVSHAGGFVKRYSVPMPCDGKGAKGNDVMTKTHAVGAAMTYGQRYLLKMIFNITIGNDNDGNDLVVGVITDEQVAELRGLINETKSDIDRFLRWAGAESLSEIRASKFAAAKAMLEQKRASEK